MKAIILAAGRGSRLNRITANQPKCMVKVHDKSLIQWQIDALKHQAIKETGIVTGYLHNEIKHSLVEFHNKQWSKSNMFYSLTKADEWLEKETCIISYSDIIYSPTTITKLINSPGDIVTTYDINWKNLWELRFENPLDDAETFVQENNRLITIGDKTNELSDIQGQYMGLLKITPLGWQEIKSSLTMLSSKEIKKLDMTSLLAFLLRQEIIIHTVANTCPWYEVDNRKDLNLYNSIPYNHFMKETL